MRRVRAILLAAFLVGSVAVAPVGGAAASDADPAAALASDAGAATAPSVTVSLGSTTAEGGGYYERGGEPTVTVEAAAGADAADGTRIDEIVVRADGERQASVSVNATEVTERIAADLDDGNNSVRVIVTDTEGNVDTTQFTLSVDGTPPSVFLTSPYETRPWYDIEDGSVTGSNATLAGEILDDSGIERLIATHEYGSASTTYTRRNPGANFSIPVFLGYNESGQSNQFRITVTDEFDNTRVYAFDVDANDGAAPSIELDPYTNETGRHEVAVSGTFTDDVWVDQARINVSRVGSNESRVTDLVTPTEYARDPDRAAVDFETDVWLREQGTYEARINVTDVDGNSVTETFAVERTSRTERSAEPEIRIDRDRTVVLDAETLFLSGAVLDGRVDRVAVETRRVATGETLDYQMVHSGSTVDRVVLDREVGIVPGRTTVIVRATDVDGEEHATRFAVNGTARETFVGEATDAETGPTVDVTSLSTDNPGEASSTVRVGGVTESTAVAIPPEPGARPVAATGNVSLTNLSVAAAANYTLGVTVRERTGSTLAAPPETTAVGTAEIQHSLDGGDVDSVALAVDVRRSYLDAHGVDPDNVSAYRRSGGNWSSVDAARSDGPNGSVRYAVDSPGLSTFSLAVDDPTDPPNGTADNGTATNGTVDDGTADNGTVDNGTTAGRTADNGTATDGTAANGTVDNGTSADGGDAAGSPQIFVGNVTVNRTTAAPGDPVVVNATLRNSGDGEGTYTAALRTIEGLNASVVETRSATVPAEERRSLSYTTRFNETGNYTVSVNGTQAGPVTVTESGGLLSVFAFVPLRLLGMGVGGIVGLLVVVVLLRFVLRRVGGGSEESGG